MIKIFGKTKHIHFIGIGGIGMSGMAEFLLNHNFTITGTDIKESNKIKELKNKGIDIEIGHSSENKNIRLADLIVYSSAVKIENPEIKKAKKINIPIIKRAELLGELIKIKSISIAIAGTHGKTTTSSMLGNILIQAKLDPALIIGGIVNNFNNNNVAGSGDIIVVEADEFDKSFLSLNPTYAIINNLDMEHLDSYKNLEELQNTFTQFANSLPFYGVCCICNDSKNIIEISKNIKKNIKTFGIKNKSEIMAKNIAFNKNKSSFQIINYKNEFKPFNVSINVPGIHNVYNALAAISIALELDIDTRYIKRGLEQYNGVRRRFDIKYSINQPNIMLIDDYAHHPKEIFATLDAINKGWKNKNIIAIFQPHLYSRTKNFYKEFANSLFQADTIIICDIYGAREKPIKNVSSELIINELKKIKHRNFYYVKNMNNIKTNIKSLLKGEDIIITMGAGNIHTIIDDLFIAISKL